MSARLFSEDRRSQTLELLFLTGMTAPQLFIAKVIGGLVIASSDLLALMPFLSIPFLAGGLSLQLFLATVVTLPALLVFIVALGVLASVITFDEGSATLTAAVLLALLCLIVPVPYGLGFAVTGQPTFSSFWLCVSPVYAPWLIDRSFGLAFPPEFWLAIGLTCVWAFLFLIAAVIVLSRNWRSDPSHNVPFWRRAWDLWRHGSKQWRFELRQRLLDVNAFSWRIRQDRRPAVLAWILVACSVGFWLAAAVAWRDQWLSTTNFFTTAGIIVIALYWLEVHTAAQHIAKERRDGTLELLLTTWLSPIEILDGVQQACGNQFRSPRRAVLLFFLAMMLVGFFVQPWNPAAVGVYLVFWAILCWFAIARPRNTVTTAVWVALISGRAAYALRRIHNFSYFGIVWMFIVFRNLGPTLGKSSTPFPEGNVAEVVVAGLWGLFVLLGSVNNWGGNALEHSFVREIRAIVQEPVPDPDDPRFGRWKNIREPFPRF